MIYTIESKCDYDDGASLEIVTYRISQALAKFDKLARLYDGCEYSITVSEWDDDILKNKHDYSCETHTVCSRCESEVRRHLDEYVNKSRKSAKIEALKQEISSISMRLIEATEKLAELEGETG